MSAVAKTMSRAVKLSSLVAFLSQRGCFIRVLQLSPRAASRWRDYHYVPEENLVFLNDKMSKIEKDAVVRFIVIGTKWLDSEREFQALVSLEGDYLGPVS
ncbi:DNA-directed RNA polymerase V subunit 7-like [Hevea brasiliensis]|uniref:DNA-directed RNA polymerase V subunit 7-like n=1 Tax=Hevea brasiliensis TaxID=3981 RepID=UPI0025F44ECF|nr:DNA-directed RNA polymerase V subunit 7-like [Hevea brasiliensis]